MKTVFRLTIASLALALIAIAAFPRRGFADTTPQEMHISCTAPNPDHQTGLHRPKGDGDHWVFSIVLDGDARFVKGPIWSYPGKNGNDPAWGMVMGGADGDSSMEWWSPGETGAFQVGVKGQIVCGDGGGGGGQPIDFSAGWEGKVEFNADIKVRRKDSGDDYSSSATVAAGGIASSEHQADVQVTATDDDGNPMDNITIPAPTIQNGDGVDTDASISPSSATTDSSGKADFTFTSSDIVQSVTLEEDGGESDANASISQQWTATLPNGGNWPVSGNDSTFEYGTPFNATFKMALDSGGTIPITGHTLDFIPTTVSGWEWDPNAGEDWDGDGSPDGDYVYKDPQDYSIIADKYGDLVTNDGTTPGSYTTHFTVHSNSDFLVDTLDFNLKDWSADDGKG